MDHCTAVLLQFLPDDGETGAPLSDESYDRLIKTHVGHVQKLIRENAGFLTAHGTELLDCLDPSANTLSYLALLDLIIPKEAALYEMVPPVVADRVAMFFTAFDARQVRYGGAAFTHVFTAVASGKILPPAVAVPLLARVLARLDPSGAMLTSNHLALARLAYHTDQAAAASLLAVLSRDIVFFPSSGGSGSGADPDGPLCSLRLPPSAYLSKETGLTLPLRSTQVLEFDFTVGMLHSAVRAWAPARDAFARVVSHPVTEGGVSKIMVQAHRRWVLLSLLLTGEAMPPCPPQTAAHVRRVCSATNREYLQMASLFPLATSTHSLRAEVALARKVLVEDGNWQLAREVLAAYPKWQIARLRDVYTTVSLSAIHTILQQAEDAAAAMAVADAAAAAESAAAGEGGGGGPALPTRTASASTGTAPATTTIAAIDTDLPISLMPASEAAVEALVEDMISTSMIRAAIRRRRRPDDDASSSSSGEEEAYLEFLPEEDLTEAAFGQRVTATAFKVQSLRPLQKATFEHISLHPKFVRQLMQRRARQDRGDVGATAGGASAAASAAGMAAGTTAGAEPLSDVDDADDEDLMTDEMGI